MLVQSTAVKLERAVRVGQADRDLARCRPDSVELGDDLGDDGVHDPLGAVGGAQKHEHRQHCPSLPVHLRLPIRLFHLKCYGA